MNAFKCFRAEYFENQCHSEKSESNNIGSSAWDGVEENSVLHPTPISKEVHLISGENLSNVSEADWPGGPVARPQLLQGGCFLPLVKP